MATIKLFESWLQSQVLNELAPIGNLDLSKLTISQAKKNEILATEEKNMVFERTSYGFMAKRSLMKLI
jgi:hypothetical protein